MKVSLSPEARADLRAIACWIDDDNPGRADSFVDALERACAGLGRQPFRFPAVQVGGRELRKRTYRGYLIFYRLLDQRLEVVRVLHGARDWTVLLAEKYSDDRGGD